MVGPLDPGALSACFNQLDVAVSLHPACVVGRSGAAAAALEHGVPVISPWGQLPSVDDAFAARWEGLLLPVDASLIAFLADPPARRWQRNLAAEAARQLLAAMATHDSFQTKGC